MNCIIRGFNLLRRASRNSFRIREDADGARPCCVLCACFFFNSLKVRCTATCAAADAEKLFSFVNVELILVNFFSSPPYFWGDAVLGTLV